MNNKLTRFVSTALLIALFIVSTPIAAKADVRDACQEIATQHAMRVSGDQILRLANGVVALGGIALQLSGYSMIVNQQDSGWIQRIVGGLIVNTGNTMAEIQFASQEEARYAYARLQISWCSDNGYYTN
jgi:hypothetical protein